MSRFNQIPLFFLIAFSNLFSAGEVEVYNETQSSAFTQPRPTKPARFSSQPIIEELRGILLIPNQDYVNYCDTRFVCGLETHDLYVPGGLDCLSEILEPMFMGKSLTQELITCLKEEIVLYYRAHDRPVVSVYVPEQEVKNGVLEIVVMEGCVGQIATSGNCWFSSWIYESFMRLGPGDAITADALQTDISWLNRNPFRNVDVIFTPGCDPGTTNIELVTCERFPVQVYIGADNTGTEASATGRYYIGGTWGNALWLDHIATYQYTTSHDFKEFQSHTFHYTAPLWWQHILLFFGGYSTVKPKLSDFEAEGTYFQGSIRYTIPFQINYQGSLQEFTMGFDFKNYNNNLLFVGDEEFAIIANTINLTQFMMGYSYGFENPCHRTAINLDIYGSPGKLLPNQSKEKYDELSPHAKVRYIYGRLTVGETLFLPWCFKLALLGRLQLASQNLLPSERFGIGGYDTVRGYLEREFNADNALILNAELLTPALSVFKFFGSCDCMDDMRFLIFFDYGLGALNNRNNSLQVEFLGDKISKTEYFMSFGPGWRYTINRYLAVRVDWGIKLHRSIFSDSARSRWHAGFVLSY